MNLQFPELASKRAFNWECAMLVRNKSQYDDVHLVFLTPGPVVDIPNIATHVTFLQPGNPTFGTIAYTEKTYDVLRVIPFTDLIISAV